MTCGVGLVPHDARSNWLLGHVVWYYLHATCVSLAIFYMWCGTCGTTWHIITCVIHYFTRAYDYDAKSISWVDKYFCHIFQSVRNVREHHKVINLFDKHTCISFIFWTTNIYDWIDRVTVDSEWKVTGRTKEYQLCAIGPSSRAIFVDVCWTLDLLIAYTISSPCSST